MADFFLTCIAAESCFRDCFSSFFFRTASSCIHGIYRVRYRVLCQTISSGIPGAYETMFVAIIMGAGAEDVRLM